MLSRHHQHPLYYEMLSFFFSSNKPTGSGCIMKSADGIRELRTQKMKPKGHSVRSVVMVPISAYTGCISYFRFMHGV